ncbi:MAG: TorF family putative porin [Gammaproteobacteria bacterium]
MTLATVALLLSGSAHGLGLIDFAVYGVLTTDYVFRGISQTREHPALQAGLDYEHATGVFAGVWGSNVEFDARQDPNRSRDFELDIYGGFRRSLGTDWLADFTVARYTYPDSSPAQKYDYTDLLLGLHYRERVAVNVAYTDDAFGFHRQGIAYELSSQYPIVAGFLASGGVGYYDLDLSRGSDYTHWTLGLSRSVGRFTLDLSYHDTDSRAADSFGEQVTGGRVVFSVAIGTE